MKKIIAIVEISRPVNVLITFAVVIVAAIICSDTFQFSTEIFLAAISAAVVAGGGNIINDYFDYEIDKINRPNRPLPSSLITKRETLSLYFLLVALSIILSLYISIEAVAIVLATNVLLYFYSSTLKKIPLIGNLVISACTALAFIYGGIVVGNIYSAIIPAVFAFLVNLVREIVKDIEDIEGDKKNHLETYPIKYGIEKSKALLIVLLIFLFIATIIPIVFRLYRIEYFIIVMFCVNLPLIYFIHEIASDHFLNKISNLSTMLKFTMIFGLLAIYLG